MASGQSRQGRGEREWQTESGHNVSLKFCLHACRVSVGAEDTPLNGGADQLWIIELEIVHAGSHRVGHHALQGIGLQQRLGL